MLSNTLDFSLKTIQKIKIRFCFKCICHDKIKILLVLAGIGLNVDNEKPTICLNSFLKELSIVDYKFAREDILATFFSKFEQFYDIFIDKGKILSC